MAEVLRACLLASRDLLRPGMLFHALWPPLLAAVLWSGIAVAVWVPARGHLLANFPDWDWLASSWGGWVSDWLANIALLMAFAPLVYFTTLMLLAAFALPRMMNLVALRDYPELARAGRGAFWGSLLNTLVAGLIFVVGWLLTLPLLLIPGVLLFMPLLWLAWLNQRTFRYDALAEHATPAERHATLRDSKPQLYAAGAISAFLAHIPIVNLLAPAWTALVFVHLCLQRLRQLRGEGVVWEHAS